MGSNCCKGDAAGKPLVRSTSSIYSRSRAGAKLDDRFKKAVDAGGVRLTISAARTGDTGVYTLQASNAAGKDTTRVRLEVSPDEKPTGDDPPTFLRRLQDLTVKVGTRTRFLVEIVSSTECRVTWYRNERRLLEAERIALVRDGNFWCADISAVSVDDAGRWTCTAENVGGRASCSAHLNVLVPKAYKRPEFVEELRALLTEQGTVSLECKVVGVPTPVLRWFKDSREIKAGDVFALTANAEDPTSLGTYTCEAVNCMGRAYSSSKVHVIGRSSRESSVRPTSGGVVLEPPPIFTKELADQFVRICESLTLSCHIVVPPWPRTVVWYNKEGKIEPNDKYRAQEDGVGGYLLEIPSAEWQDEGEWKCVATSSGGRIGITTCYVSMDVPKNYRKPRFMENLQAVLTEEGLVSFECKVVGFPTPILSWFKDGQELKPGDVYQLTGTNSLGSYCCIARNCMGQASSSAELTVEDIQNQLNEEEKLQLFSKNQAPKFLQGLKSVEAKIDEPFRFTIKVTIPPEPTVLWYRDDQPVDESSRCHHGKEERGVFFLDIQSLEFMDQAEWKCVAMNDFGHSVTSCFLKLIIPRHYKKPRFLENLQAILSDEGAVNLECKVIGVPQPVLKWYKDGEELKPGDIHRIISGQDGTCCLGTYTCEAQNCMGIAASSASLLGFEDSIKSKSKKNLEEQTLQRNLSLSTIHEERTSQMYDTPVGDITLDDKGEISFSFDGKEVSVSLYETPDLTEEEALQIVEMYADQLSENVTEHNVVELPPLRFVKETSTSGNLLMEAIIIDVSPEYFTSPEEDLRTEADVEDISIADENGLPQLSLDQEMDAEDYLEKTIAILSDEKVIFPKKTDRKKSDSQKSADDYFSLSRDQSLSEEKKDDDTQVLSESDLQSFASARSSGKPKSKSSKPSIEDGPESSEITKTVLLNEDLQNYRKQIEVDSVIKNKRERRSRSSRRSSSGSEKSLSKMREEHFENNLVNISIEPSLDRENASKDINKISLSLTKVINEIQMIERDIILKSELMSTAATASRSLEIINSLITPLTEIHSIIEAIKETVSESPITTSSLFNRLPQCLGILHKNLTIIEKCIDVESENKTLVKKTCTNIIGKCGEELLNLVREINFTVDKGHSFLEVECISTIHTNTNELLSTLTSSISAVKDIKIASNEMDSNIDKTTPELKHLQKTQKAIYELRNPLKSLLYIAEEVDINSFIAPEHVTNNQVILNDMSTPIQDLQNALEQIELLSVSENQLSLQKYNTDIIETVMDSVIKLRTSFEQLSVEVGTTDNLDILKDILITIKHNINEISAHLDIFEAKIGPFNILHSENKLEALQKMAQILINLENNLNEKNILDTTPSFKMNMTDFHKNLTKVLEHVIESNDAKKYLTFLEICDGVNRLNTLIKNIDIKDALSLTAISNNLKTIQASIQKNEFTPELNFSIITNTNDLLANIHENVNHADSSTYSVISENAEDLSIKSFEEEKLNIVLQQIEKAMITVSNVISLETTKDLEISHALNKIIPTLAEIKCCVASLNVNIIDQDDNISDLSTLTFPQAVANPLCELNHGISVLNQIICEKASDLSEKDLLRVELLTPLIELRHALEILQQDVVSQISENVINLNISSTIANAVQSVQNCIIMVQDHDLLENADELSTLEDISAIKTTADILHNDYFIPNVEEINTTIDAEIVPSILFKTLEILGEQMSTLQKSETLKTLTTISEHAELSYIKSFISKLDYVHNAIETISANPNINDESQKVTNFTNFVQLLKIIQPLQELYQCLLNIELGNITVKDTTQKEQIKEWTENISNFENCLRNFLDNINLAVETANVTLEISTEVSTARENCIELKNNMLNTFKTDVLMDGSQLLVLEKSVNNVLDTLSLSQELDISQIKLSLENLQHNIITVQDDILGYAVENPIVLHNEIQILKSIDDFEKSISSLAKLQFLDIIQDSNYSKVRLEQLNKVQKVIEVISNYAQNSSQDMPNREEFVKTFTNELTLLSCLLQQKHTPKRIIKMVQIYYDLCQNWRQFQLHEKNSRMFDEDFNEWLVNSEDCLKNIQTLLIELIESQSQAIFDIPISNINNLEIFFNKHIELNEMKTENLFDSVNFFINTIRSIKPWFETVKDDLIKELKHGDINLSMEYDVNKHFNLIYRFISEQIDKCNTLEEEFETIFRVIKNHSDCERVNGTTKKVIFIKCLSECLSVLKQTIIDSIPSIKDEKLILNDNDFINILMEIAASFESVHGQIIKICSLNLQNLDEKHVLKELSEVDSHLETINKIKVTTENYLKSENMPIKNNYALTLTNEILSKIHLIQKNLQNLGCIYESMHMIINTQPISDIENILTTILSAEVTEEEKRHLKEKTESLLQHMEHYIEIIEIVEEVSAVIKLDDFKKSADIVRELRETITSESSSDVNLSDAEIKKEQIQLVQNLQKALTTLQIEAFDREQELAAPIIDDMRQQIIEVVSDLQNDLVALSSNYVVLENSESLAAVEIKDAQLDIKSNEVRVDTTEEPKSIMHAQSHIECHEVCVDKTVEPKSVIDAQPNIESHEVCVDKTEEPKSTIDAQPSIESAEVCEDKTEEPKFTVDAQPIIESHEISVDKTEEPKSTMDAQPNIESAEVCVDKTEEPKSIMDVQPIIESHEVCVDKTEEPNSTIDVQPSIESAEVCVDKTEEPKSTVDAQPIIESHEISVDKTEEPKSTMDSQPNIESAEVRVYKTEEPKSIMDVQPIIESHEVCVDKTEESNSTIDAQPSIESAEVCVDKTEEPKSTVDAQPIIESHEINVDKTEEPKSTMDAQPNIESAEVRVDKTEVPKSIMDAQTNIESDKICVDKTEELISTMDSQPNTERVEVCEDKTEGPKSTIDAQPIIESHEVNVDKTKESKFTMDAQPNIESAEVCVDKTEEPKSTIDTQTNIESVEVCVYKTEEPKSVMDVQPIIESHEVCLDKTEETKSTMDTQPNIESAEVCVDKTEEPKSIMGVKPKIESHEICVDKTDEPISTIDAQPNVESLEVCEDKTESPTIDAQPNTETLEVSEDNKQSICTHGVKEVTDMKTDIEFSNSDIHDESVATLKSIKGIMDEKLSTIQELESLLKEVNDNLSERYCSDSYCEELRDSLEQVQSIILKLKCEFAGSTNDVLNENIEDLECNVRSVQLQINESSPPALLKEACANLQSLAACIINICNTQSNSFEITSNNTLCGCTNNADEAIELLNGIPHHHDDSKLDTIILNLNTIRDAMKSLKSSFSDDSTTVIVEGIEILQNLDLVEDKVFALEKELEAKVSINLTFRDNIIAAIHSIYGSISNMRGTICIIQKKYMYDNYGLPTDNFLKSIKNVKHILHVDENRDWAQFSKSLRKVLNHFEDIKFYINLDKTARIPSDSAFTKIILGELSSVLSEVVLRNINNLDNDLKVIVEDAVNHVNDVLNKMENKSTLEVKDKIPVFKELSIKMIDLTDRIKIVLQKTTNIIPQKLLVSKDQEKQETFDIKNPIDENKMIEENNTDTNQSKLKLLDTASVCTENIESIIDENDKIIYTESEKNQSDKEIINHEITTNKEDTLIDNTGYEEPAKAETEIQFETIEIKNTTEKLNNEEILSSCAKDDLTNDTTSNKNKQKSTDGLIDENEINDEELVKKVKEISEKEDETNKDKLTVEKIDCHMLNVEVSQDIVKSNQTLLKQPAEDLPYLGENSVIVEDSTQSVDVKLEEANKENVAGKDFQKEINDTSLQHQIEEIASLDLLQKKEQEEIDVKATTAQIENAKFEVIQQKEEYEVNSLSELSSELERNNNNIMQTILENRMAETLVNTQNEPFLENIAVVNELFEQQQSEMHIKEAADKNDSFTGTIPSLEGIEETYAKQNVSTVTQRSIENKEIQNEKTRNEDSNHKEKEICLEHKQVEINDKIIQEHVDVVNIKQETILLQLKTDNDNESRNQREASAENAGKEDEEIFIKKAISDKNLVNIDDRDKAKMINLPEHKIESSLPDKKITENKGQTEKAMQDKKSHFKKEDESIIRKQVDSKIETKEVDCNITDENIKIKGNNAKAKETITQVEPYLKTEGEIVVRTQDVEKIETKEVDSNLTHIKLKNADIEDNGEEIITDENDERYLKKEHESIINTLDDEKLKKNKTETNYDKKIADKQVEQYQKEEGETYIPARQDEVMKEKDSIISNKKSDEVKENITDENEKKNLKKDDSKEKYKQEEQSIIIEEKETLSDISEKEMKKKDAKAETKIAGETIKQYLKKDDEREADNKITDGTFKKPENEGNAEEKLSSKEMDHYLEKKVENSKKMEIDAMYEEKIVEKQVEHDNVTDKKLKIAVNEGNADEMIAHGSQAKAKIVDREKEQNIEEADKTILSKHDDKKMETEETDSMLIDEKLKKEENVKEKMSDKETEHYLRKEDINVDHTQDYIKIETNDTDLNTDERTSTKLQKSEKTQCLKKEDESIQNNIKIEKKEPESNFVDELSKKGKTESISKEKLAEEVTPILEKQNECVIRVDEKLETKENDYNVEKLKKTEKETMAEEKTADKKEEQYIKKEDNSVNSSRNDYKIETLIPGSNITDEKLKKNDIEEKTEEKNTDIKLEPCLIIEDKYVDHTQQSVKIETHEKDTHLTSEKLNKTENKDKPTQIIADSEMKQYIKMEDERTFNTINDSKVESKDTDSNDGKLNKTENENKTKEFNTDNKVEQHLKKEDEIIAFTMNNIKIGKKETDSNKIDTKLIDLEAQGKPKEQMVDEEVIQYCEIEDESVTRKSVDEKIEIKETDTNLTVEKLKKSDKNRKAKEKKADKKEKQYLTKEDETVKSTRTDVKTETHKSDSNIVEENLKKTENKGKVDVKITDKKLEQSFIKEDENVDLIPESEKIEKKETETHFTSDKSNEKEDKALEKIADREIKQHIKQEDDIDDNRRDDVKIETKDTVSNVTDNKLQKTENVRKVEEIAVEKKEDESFTCIRNSMRNETQETGISFADGKPTEKENKIKFEENVADRQEDREQKLKKEDENVMFTRVSNESTAQEGKAKGQKNEDETNIFERDDEKIENNVNVKAGTLRKTKKKERKIKTEEKNCDIKISETDICADESQISIIAKTDIIETAIKKPNDELNIDLMKKTENITQENLIQQNIHGLETKEYTTKLTDEKVEQILLPSETHNPSIIEVKQRPLFIDRSDPDYELDFFRPSGYTSKSYDVDNSLLECKTSSKAPAVYKAQTLVHEAQHKSSVPPYIDQRSTISEGRGDLKHRSKAVSETRSAISEKRSSFPRDSKRKPIFSTHLTDRTAVESSRVKLTCSILSSTDPVISWYKNGKLLDNKQKCRTKYVDGLITLEILNVVPGDSGEYSCTVENENGSITSSANLKVYPGFETSPIPPTFTRSIRDFYHLHENELVLECRIRGQPLPKITWLKDNRPIILNERYQAHYLADGVCRLTIISPNEDDSGKYTCKAENSMWSDQITHEVHFTNKERCHIRNITTMENISMSRQATESRRPHFTNVLSDHKVVSGGTIGLQVEISGSPTRVEWLREGRSITETYTNAQTYIDHDLYTLALSNVTEKESGLYTCRAWSTHGNVDMNASVIVVQPNEFEGKPATIISRPAKDLLISVGEDLNISFRVQGEPKPKVFFMKGIRDITTSQRVCKMTSDDYVKFTLKRSVVSDAGTYCVFARNAYGCDRAFVTVVIRQRASSENLISDWTYPMDDLVVSVVDRNYKSVPDRIPSEPNTVDGGNNWISLAWLKPESQGKAPILAYKVESWLLGKEGGARWTELGITPRNSFDAFNLKQGEEYHFRVTPRNRYGWGESVQTTVPIGIGLAGDRPEFIEILPGQLKVLVGETANLCCSFKGNPMPGIVWMKNGHEVEEETERVRIQLSGNNTSLQINNINIEDEGRYSCEATNIHGRSSTYSRMAVITDKQIWAADVKLKRERSAGANGEYPPQFTMRLRDRRVQCTYPVRLTCQVIGSPSPTVTWFKNGEEVTEDCRHSTSQDEYFHTLEIAPTTLDDGGVYEAMARNGSGAISCRCNLVVDKGIRAYIAPEFCCGFDPLYSVCEGDELRISAIVEAYPSVGVTWYRDGVRLRPSRRAVMTLDRDGQIELALASVATRDAGVYTCTASNEVGRASTSGKVEVVRGESTSETSKVPPIVISPDVPYSKEPMFIRKPRSSEAREGDTVLLECEVIGDPKPEVYWLRDFLKPDYYRDASHFKRVGAGPGYRFEIPHAKLDYTGAYSIVAKNVHGEAKAIISLQILAKDLTCSDDSHNIRYGRVDVIPRFEKELTDMLCYDGDAIEFECRISGNPEPDIRWFHYTEVVPECGDFETSFDHGSARLKIKQVTAEDEGTYICEAANNMGKATSSACLVIYPPGEPNTLSQTLRRPPALLSAASTPRSTPRTTPARSLSRTPGPDLRRLGSPSREIAPKFYTYPYNKVVEEGDTVVFQCAVKGLPPPWATWDKDGIIITPTARISIREKDDMFRILEIEQVTVEDVGLYRVTLENDYGRAEASARLDVISQTGKFHGSRSYSVSPRRCQSYRRRTPSLTRYD
ncbi:uncharacterized protein LOC112045836 isoform X2 [Bicyclus anynana]|uniref:Uncharacterized protein LOC112045836 isoform X2 n=1 Tax=Bicyclus anynana TaxID=110368 RepID=A0A6J1MTU2_BICAN|nr:uncharacterized protein LOC112045836 isoform X2 [Bicyclus anynana]